MTARRDIWAEWLAEHRSGGDAEVRREMLSHLAVVRDKVLDRADFAAGESLLDVGCGGEVLRASSPSCRGRPRRLADGDGVPQGRQAVSSRPACHEAHSFA